nr:immunoglobulin heavy chain junction region [Mus musculus]
CARRIYYDYKGRFFDYW